MSLNRVCFSKKFTYFSLATALLFFCLIYLSQRLLTQRQSSSSKAAPATNKSSIIGGEYAKEGEFPNVVYVAPSYQGWNFAGCTGTIIKPGWVISAAHCFFQVKPDSTGNPTNELRKLSGIYIYKDTVDATGLMLPWENNLEKLKGVEFYVPKIDGFDPFTTLGTDLALVKLDVAITDRHMPKLPVPKNKYIAEGGTKKFNGFDPIVKVGMDVTAVGFGCSSKNLEANVPKLPNERIFERKLKKVEIPISSINDYPNIIEFGYLDGDVRNYNKSSCSGDSGGPLFLNHDEVTYIIGVMSKSNMAELPYASWAVNIQTQLNWIEEITKQNSLCRFKNKNVFDEVRDDYFYRNQDQQFIRESDCVIDTKTNIKTGYECLQDKHEAQPALDPTSHCSNDILRLCANRNWTDYKCGGGIAFGTTSKDGYSCICTPDGPQPRLIKL